MEEAGKSNEEVEATTEINEEITSSSSSAEINGNDAKSDHEDLKPANNENNNDDKTVEEQLGDKVALDSSSRLQLSIITFLALIFNILVFIK